MTQYQLQTIKTINIKTIFLDYRASLAMTEKLGHCKLLLCHPQAMSSISSLRANEVCIANYKCENVLHVGIEYISLKNFRHCEER
ncbi:MAG: hypothetical protein LBJ88_06395 [Campylobacteraceae bacterium]|nr:hypothetical protein [Campylobacteraceae bacterium]